MLGFTCCWYLQGFFTALCPTHRAIKNPCKYNITISVCVFAYAFVVVVAAKSASIRIAVAVVAAGMSEIVLKLFSIWLALFLLRVA